MFSSKCLAVNKNNNLTIGGVSVLDIVREYGSPLYIMDEGNIRDVCREYKSAMHSHFNDNYDIAFASKAFCSKYMYKILADEGLSADVVSGGEIYTALSAGFSAKNLYFHGNNKSYDELKYAIENDIGRIVVDNAEEMDIIQNICIQLGKTANIYFRIKPGIDAHTHDFIRTGQIDSKFGFALENGEAIGIVKNAANYSNINLCGLHCHIGSQIFDNEPFEEAARVMMGFIKQIKDDIGIDILELNLGGGFGICYTNEDDPKTPKQNISATFSALSAASLSFNIPIPKIVIEPGRSIVGSSGITAYTVGSIKNIEGVRTYVAIDGGMTDNPRYALYQSKYDILSAINPLSPKTETYTIAGKCCESGDLIGKDVKMNKVTSGDIICVLSTGAYNYSMSSNYNRLPKPAVVMVRDGKCKLVVKRETYDDIIRNDVL